jgi:hypothetical protein
MITVGFVSPTGFLLSASAETLALALTQLQDQTGVDAKEAYGEARSYLHWRYKPRTDGIAEALPDSSTGPTAVQDQDAPQAKEDDQGRSETTRNQHTGGTPSSVAVDETCTVCGGAVPEVLAELAKQRWNAVMCKGCGNW